MLLKNKRILIISPQRWGTMRVSKHHYASKLAEMGNTVYFLDPPILGKVGGASRVEIVSSDITNSLFIVRDYISFPYFIKFHLSFLFYFLMRSHVKEIIKKIGKPLDIVWSFDLSNVYPLHSFPDSAYRIFHPVDMPHMLCGIQAAKGANIILSTSLEILKKYNQFKIPAFFIEHGLADEFLDYNGKYEDDSIVRIGYSGNLLRTDIDRKTLITIVRGHPAVIFEFWGSYAPAVANVGSNDDRLTLKFVEDLEGFSNVILHGPVSFDILPAEFARMDGFLICYDIQAKNAIGPNYHKLMEYFSSGMVVISSYINNYVNRYELIQMVTERTNEKLPVLFNQVLNNLAFHNNIEKQKARIEYVRLNTYDRQLIRIGEIISSNISSP